MAGWNDPLETVIAGSGEVYVGAVGSTLPTTTTGAPAAAFSGLGFHTEDGVSVSNTPELIRLKAWQSKTPIRVIRETDTFTISFALEQWNEITTPLAFGGGAITGSAPYKYTPPLVTDAPDEKALICDVIDGARILRFIVPRGITTETVESKFSRTELAVLPITFEALTPSDGSAPWYFLTDDAAAFAVGS